MDLDRKASYIAAGKACRKNRKPTIGPLDATDTQCVVYTKCFRTAIQVFNRFARYEAQLEQEDDLYLVLIPFPTKVVCERLAEQSTIPVRHKRRSA